MRDNTPLETTIDTPSDVASLYYSSNANGWNTCGDRTYSIVDANGNTPTWVTAINVPAVVDANGDTQVSSTFVISVAIDDESYVSASPHSMTITVAFANYPVSDDAAHPTKSWTFDVVVAAATCDCSLIIWNDPENIPLIMNAMVVTSPATQELLEAGPLESSLTATSGARACDHVNDECDYAYTITARMAETAEPLPDWIVYNQPILTATPVLAEHIGEWFVELEQIRISNQVTTVYTAAHIIVGCQILTWTPPTMPTTAEATYTVFDPEKIITMAPEFDQQPPCGYTAEMDFKWTIPAGAHIFKQQNPYSLQVTTTDVGQDGIYTVFLKNHIEYTHVDFGLQTWDETVSYDITIQNPCGETELYYETTFLSEMEYQVGSISETQSFTPVTDTVSNAITTSGNCGEIIYTLKNNATEVGTPFIYVVDLLNAKGLRIYTEDDDMIGNYTITVTATLENYPSKTVSFAVPVQIQEALANLPD